MADLEHGIPITSGTIFNVGSISKQFTGLAVASLFQAGKLSADDDIRDYVPELPGYGTAITLRELLAHTSGLRDDRTLALMAGWRDDDLLTGGDLLGLIYRQQGLNSPPGQAYLYSNSDYSLLALAVQRAAGQPLAQYAAARIFGPLGMASTHFEEDPFVVVPGRADAYEPYSDTYRLSLPDVAMPGPTGLDTTVGDLMLWADNFSTGRVGGPAAIQQMMAPASLADGSPVYYNFGLMQRTYADLGYTIGHDGLEGGFKSELLILPARRQAVAVLCNLETIDPAPLAEQAARLFAGLSPFPTPAPSPAPAVSAEAAITLPGSTLASAGRGLFRSDEHRFPAPLRRWERSGAGRGTGHRARPRRHRPLPGAGARRGDGRRGRVRPGRRREIHGRDHGRRHALGQIPAVSAALRGWARLRRHVLQRRTGRDLQYHRGSRDPHPEQPPVCAGPLAACGAAPVCDGRGAARHPRRL